MKLPCLTALAVVCLPLALHAQSTVFSDSFAGDSLDPAAYPAVTASTTGWDVASSKTAPAPTDSSGLQINMVSTSSGFIEAQALFTGAPIQLIPGTNIQLTGVFTPTNVLVHASDVLNVGFFNSGGSAPLSGLISSGLSSSSTTFAAGGAKGWQGYNAAIAFTAGTSKMATRAAQTGTNNTNQDVVIAAQSSSAGYSNPAAVTTGSSTTAVAALTNGATYTLAYNLALSASGTTLTATCSIYNGAGTTGTGSNTLVASYTGSMTGTTLLATAFDAMALGWRADASLASDLNFSSLVVSTTAGPPTFVTQPPASTAISVGGNLVLTAAVSGAASYQWQVSTDGGATFSSLGVAANPSAGTASLSIADVQPAEAGTYQLIATNAAGSVTSTPAVVVVSTAAVPPAITAQPAAASAPQGGAASFTVAATGVPPPSYLWSLNGAPLADGTQADGSVVSGSATAALAIGNVMPDENGAALTVAVTNVAGSATSTPATLTVLAPLPTITTQTSPSGQTAAAGSGVSFTAAATGATSYQWLFNGSPITGNPSAQTTTLMLGALTPLNAGTYALAAINAGGSTLSAPAILNVTAAAGAPALPVIPGGDFNVTAFGAVGNGATDNTAAIQSAINAAIAAGGGTVEIPAATGAYLSGPLTLGGSISLQVDAGATLQALPFGTYPDASNNPAIFVSFKNASNVQIVGGGTIDGNGSGWWNAFDTSGVSRPDLVKFSNCTDVLVAGVTLSNAPIEHLVPDGCTNVTIDGLTVATPASSPNTDGIDPSGTNILIENCSIADGDDNIAVKPENTLCSNIVITGCAFGAGHGLSVGGQTNAGLNGLTVTNCTFNGTLTGLRLKADATEGGPVQNLSYSNITMTNVPSPIVFYSYYNQVGTPGATSGSNQTTVAKVNSFNATPPNSLAASTLPTWQNIAISNVTATGASQYSLIWGLPLANGLFSGVTLNNVTIAGGAGFEIYNAANVQVTGSSSLGTLVTDNALAITGQPQDQATSTGGTAVFSVTTAGASGVAGTPPAYLWSLNGTALMDGVQADGSVVSGSATATLTLSNAKVTDAGSYAVTVSNNLDGYNVAGGALSANSLPVAATSAAASLAVQPSAVTVTLSNLSQTYTGLPLLPTVTTSPAGAVVALTFNGSGTAPTAAGSYALVATVNDPNYTGGGATGTLVIAPATPALAWSAPAPIVFGTPLGAAQLDAVSNVAGSFAYAPPAGTILPPGASQALSATFTPTDAVDYAAGGTVGTTITVNSAVATVALGNLSQVYSGAGEPVTVATTPSGLAAAVTYNGGSALPVTAGSYAVVATVTSPGFTGSAAGTLVIAKAAPVLTWNAPAPINAGTALGAAQLDATANVAGSFAYTPPAGTVLKVGTQGLSALFTPTDAVDYAAGTVATTITVKQATATIVLSGLDQDYTGQPLPVTATTNPAGLAVALTYNGSATAPTDPGTYDVVATITDPNYMGTIAGTMVIMTTGLVNQAPVLNGNAAFEGSIQLLSPESVSLSGNAYISGDLLVPGTPALQTSGNARVAGTINAGGTATPTNYQVSLSGNALLRDLVRQVNPVAMPAVAAPPASNQNVTLNGNAAPTTLLAGNYGSVIVNGSTTLIVGVAGATTPSVYNIQNLTLNGNAVLEVVGPATITVGNAVTLNGNSGASAHPDWLVLAVAKGGVTLNGGVTFDGNIIAPAGQVIVNGNSTLNGTVMANSLLLNGGAIVDPNGL